MIWLARGLALVIAAAALALALRSAAPRAGVGWQVGDEVFAAPEPHLRYRPATGEGAPEELAVWAVLPATGKTPTRIALTILAPSSMAPPATPPLGVVTGHPAALLTYDPGLPETERAWLVYRSDVPGGGGFVHLMTYDAHGGGRVVAQFDARLCRRDGRCLELRNGWLALAPVAAKGGPL